jgi:hypothetical protein
MSEKRCARDERREKMLEMDEGERECLAAGKAQVIVFDPSPKRWRQCSFTMTAIPILDLSDIVSLDNLVAFIHLSTLRRQYDDIVGLTCGLLWYK